MKTRLILCVLAALLLRTAFSQQCPAQKNYLSETKRLYLHVSNWPQDGQLVVPGLGNKVSTAYLLSDSQRSPLGATGGDEWVKIAVGQTVPFFSRDREMR